MPNADIREALARYLAAGGDRTDALLIPDGIDGIGGLLPAGLRSVRLSGGTLAPEGLAQRILQGIGSPRMEDPGPVLAAYAAHLRACGRDLVLALDGPEALPEATLRWLGDLVRRARGSLRLVLAGREAARVPPAVAALGLEVREIAPGWPKPTRVRRRRWAVASCALVAAGVLSVTVLLRSVPMPAGEASTRPAPEPAAEPTPVVAEVPSPAPVPAPFKQWSYDPDVDRISFSVRGAPLEAVLDVLARQAGFRLTSYVGDRLKTPVTLAVVATTVESAVRTLLRDFQSGFVLKGEPGAPLRLVTVRVLAERTEDLAAANAPRQ